MSCGRGCESALWLQKTPKICEYKYLRKEGHSHGWKNYPWGCTCLLCGSSILSDIPDFACYKIHALKAPTLLLLLNIHQVGKMGQDGVNSWHLISLFAQGVSDGSHVCWLLLLWFSRATEQTKSYREYASVWLLLLLALELGHYPLLLKWCPLYGGRAFLCLL